MEKHIVKSAQEQAFILGIGLNSTSKKEVLRSVRASLRNWGRKDVPIVPFFITTPNSEILLKAQNNGQLAEIINLSTFAIPDGVGLQQAYRFLELWNPKLKAFRPFVLIPQGLWVGASTFINRKWLNDGLPLIKGREMFKELLSLANAKKWRVAMLGDSQPSATFAKQELEKSHKSVKLYDFEGPVLNDLGDPKTDTEARKEKAVIEKISEIAPHIVFVGFGAPKQEKWVFRHIEELNCGGVMVVGKTLEWVGRTKRLAPVWMGKYGIEWVWRLLTGSTSLKRIINAVIVFPWTVYKYKLLKD